MMANTQEDHDDDWLASDEAKPVRDAMRRSMEALGPTEESKAAAWKRIEATMAPHFGRANRSWIAQLQDWFSIKTLAPIAILVLAVGIWVMLPESNPELVEFKSGSQQLHVPDFSAEEPSAVSALKTLGISYTYRVEGTSGMLVITVPDPVPATLTDWAAQHDLKSPLPGTWMLLVLPQEQNQNR